ncbi:MAG: PhzF family phenazine biosynthesis protein, partial [Bacteroidota bacterium]
DDSLLQNIAMENNLSETAFFVKEREHYHIRWMTPITEVPLCGHATLASAFVIFNFIEKDTKKIKFTSKSGELFVEREVDLLAPPFRSSEGMAMPESLRENPPQGRTLNTPTLGSGVSFSAGRSQYSDQVFFSPPLGEMEGALLSLDFPANKPKRIPVSSTIRKCFDKEPLEVLEDGFFALIVFDSEDYIRNYLPNFESIKQIHPHAVIITARGKEVDFVSRVFVPNEGINEDPVTGSAHTVLVPYWSEKLGKKNFRALQVSNRGGELFCKDLGSRVKISGKAVLYSTGNLFLSL